MSHWTTLAVVAGYGTLFLLSDSQQKRQARELQSTQRKCSQTSSSSSSSRCSLSHSPSSSFSLSSPSYGIEDLRRDAAEENQKKEKEEEEEKEEEDLRRRFSQRRRSIRTKTKKDLRSVGCVCFSTAVSLPPLSSCSCSCSCSSYVIRKDATVHPSSSSLTVGCGGSTGEKSQSPCSSCSCIQASASVSARILHDDGKDARGNLDDGNDAENSDDDDKVVWSQDDGNDEGNTDDDNGAGKVDDDDDNDGRSLEKSKAHRPIGVRRSPLATAAAVDDEEEGNKWNNSICLGDNHSNEFVSRLQDDDWRHFEGQKVVITRVSEDDENLFDARFKRKSHPKRNLQDSTSHKTNLQNNAESSHKTNLRDKKNQSHKTYLPSNAESSNKINLRDKKPRNNTFIPNNTETKDKTNLPNNKKPRTKINLPNNKPRVEINLPSNAGERGKTNLPKNAQPSYPRKIAESKDERNIGKKAEPSAVKVAESSANSSANDVISTSSFRGGQESEVWQKRDLMHYIGERHSRIESTASSDMSCNVTKTLSSCSLLIDRLSVKEEEEEEVDHHRTSTDTGGSNDGCRDYPSNASIGCCGCDSSDTQLIPNSRDATAAEENSSTEFGFESFLSYDQPIDCSHEKGNESVSETDLPRKKEKPKEELCRSDAIPSRAEQSLKKCTDDDSKQRSSEAAVPLAGADVVTPSASIVQSSGTNSLVRCSFLRILDWTFIVLLLILIVLYTLDHLFDLTRSKGQQRTVSTELHSSCDQSAVTCGAKD